MARRGAVSLARGDVRITTADRQIEREALNMSILLAASVPVGVALLGCLCLLWLGIGQGLAPLNRLREALMRRNADSLEPLQVQSFPSELKPLLDTQNQLFQRIGKTIERERRLTGDAAHELRSPLTAIKTHLQVARMTEGSARDQSLARAEEGADRMHRTLEQLLLLARVEGSLSFDDGVQCSAEQVAKLAMQDAAGGERQRIKLHLPSSPVRRCNAGGAVDCRVAQPARQRLRHTPADAEVELSLETVGQRAFCGARPRPGIAAEDLQHLTQRFWRNGQSTGCGLGLAIVQAIVQRCACTLHFDSRADGLRVELTMPLQSL
jgi:signal transduction histidine kinase